MAWQPGNHAYCSEECRDEGERQRNLAYALMAQAKASGIIVDPRSKLCTDCGEQARFYDHRDYSKPMMVEPVCWSCNIRRGPGIYQARAA